jgi:hypothetical protein
MTTAFVAAPVLEVHASSSVVCFSSLKTPKQGHSQEFSGLMFRNGSSTGGSMRTMVASLVVFGGVFTAMTASSQNTPAAPTDVYHVHFTKAAPGQASALAKFLMTPEQSAPMPEHFVVLRHQEGDDWDFVVIQHLGAKSEVTAAPSPLTDAQRALSAWHTDTFVSGPSWGEFTKEMGIGGASASSLVYVVGVHRPVPGHREQLLKSLSGPGPDSKIQTGNLLLQHIEGSEWAFATITRYNSWQDFASDRAAAASAGDTTAGGWSDIRQHSAFHRDTVADRIYPAK